MEGVPFARIVVERRPWALLLLSSSLSLSFVACVVVVVVVTVAAFRLHVTNRVLDATVPSISSLLDESRLTSTLFSGHRLSAHCNGAPLTWLNFRLVFFCFCHAFDVAKLCLFLITGQSVALPLWVRGRGGGRQTVRMIVRYKRAPPSSSSAEGGGGEGEGGVLPPSSDKLFRCIAVLCGGGCGLTCGCYGLNF